MAQQLMNQWNRSFKESLVLVIWQSLYTFQTQSNLGFPRTDGLQSWQTGVGPLHHSGPLQAPYWSEVIKLEMKFEILYILSFCCTRLINIWFHLLASDCVPLKRTLTWATFHWLGRGQPVKKCLHVTKPLCVSQVHPDRHVWLIYNWTDTGNKHRYHARCLWMPYLLSQCGTTLCEASCSGPFLRMTGRQDRLWQQPLWLSSRSLPPTTLPPFPHCGMQRHLSTPLPPPPWEVQ